MLVHASHDLSELNLLEIDVRTDVRLAPLTDHEGRRTGRLFCDRDDVDQLGRAGALVSRSESCPILCWAAAATS